jgi:tetratricopeptide (TPR) repeat protein
LPASRSADTLHRLLAVVVGLTLAVGVAGSRSGDANAQTKTVAPDPRYRVYIHGPIGAFSDPDVVQAEGATPDVKGLESALNDYFADHDDRFVLLDSDLTFEGLGNATKLLKNLRSADRLVEKAEEARARFDLRVAERNLREATAAYEEVEAPVFFPDEVARAYEYLGLIYASQGRKDEAVEVFVRMLELDPTRVLVHPFYFEATEARFREARARLLNSRANGPNDNDRSVLRRIGEAVDGSLVITAFVVQTGDKSELVLFAFRRDGESQTFLPVQRVELTGDPAIDVERANRLASRIAACVEPLPTPAPKAPESDKGTLYVDSTFSYYVFFVTETGATFPNLGLSIDGSYLLTDNFAMVARVNFLTAGDDTSGEQLTDFTTIRLSLGGGFSFRLAGGWVRPYLNITGEAANFGRFERTTSFFCKVNPESSECDQDDIVSEASGWLYGVATRAGVSFKLYRDLYATVGGGLSFYFIPRDLPALNFPLGFDSGLEYRF